MRLRILPYAAVCPLVLIGSACTASPQLKEERFLKQGQAQMAKNDYARAALDFLSAAQAMPTDAEPPYQWEWRISQARI